MPIHGRQPKPMPPDQALASARAALAMVDTPPGCDADSLRAALPSVVSHWPAWVVRAGVFAMRGAYCIWCEPHPAPQETFPSQLILNVPAGRYVVDVLDVSRRAWAFRESVTGAPLVTGLPYTAGTVLVWIRLVEQPAVPVPPPAIAIAPPAS